MKKLLSSILALSMLSVPAVCAHAAGDISVTLDGKEIAFDAKPQIINERVMVPMRKMFEAIDAKISWDGEKSAATAIKEAQYITFTDKKDSIEIGVCKDGKDDGELLYYADKPLDSAAVIKDGTMYVPMRVLAETFHYNVEWNADKNRAEITSPEESDDVIYYSSWTDGGHMYRADANGQHRQILSTDDCYAARYGSFGYGNGYIFYSIRDVENRDSADKVEGQLYRIKTDGTGREKLTENVAILLGDYSNYTPSADENGDLFFLMSDKTNGEEYSPYNTQTYIYRINAKSGEMTKLLDEPIEDYLTYLYKDYIYFKYDSDEIDKTYSVYRMDKDGENIINVTGNVAASYIRFDTENDRIKFNTYNSGIRKEYSAALDGSDVQITTTEDETRNNSGLAYMRYRGDGFSVGIKDYDDADYGKKYIVVDDEGKELSVITAPEGYELGGITSVNNKIYYEIYRDYHPEFYKTIYVTSLDELLGMENISVGEEKVDGKYEIKRRRTEEEWEELYKTFDFEPQIRSVNLDGSDDEKVLDGYSILSPYYGDNGENEDNKGKIKISSIDDELNNVRKYYLFDPNTKSMEEHEVKAPSRADGIMKNEDVHYGIVVKGDGEVQSYWRNNW